MDMSKRPSKDEGDGSNDNRSSDSHMSSDKSITISNTNDNGQPLSISSLPLELIEMILMETVVAQTLSARLNVGLHACISPHDNLIDFCPAWREILRQPQFRKRVFDRLARTEPNALYKQQADPVKIQGFRVGYFWKLFAVVTLNDKLYSMEAESSDLDSPFGLDSLQRFIFVYDMKINDHLPHNNDENQLEVVCTNKRQLPSVDGLLNPFQILASRQDNCIYVASLVENVTDCRIFKLASDGKFVVSWAVGFYDPLHLRGCLFRIAFDPCCQYLVVVYLRSAKVFNTLGSLLASIQLPNDRTFPSSIAVLCDATIVMSYLTAQGPMFSVKVAFVKAQQISDGLLEYEDLSSALLPVPTSDYLRPRMGSLLSDCCGRIMVVGLYDTDLVLVDRERKTTRFARSKNTYLGCHHHFDESHGLLFITSSRGCHAEHVRYNRPL